MVKYFTDVNFSKRGEKEVQSLINLMIADGMIAKGLHQEAFVDWESKYKST
jgi:dTDP-glucose pyrophosphorylase